MRQKTLEDMHNELEKDLRFMFVSEIITEERTLKYFKSMYVKHAFDAMGNKFKQLYLSQEHYLNALKNAYKVAYGA